MSYAFSLRRPVAAALAALLISTGWSASAARAADNTNIPGVPLPANVVTGQLGGTIYDRVYSVDVVPNSIILVSLTGESGTDFDLYLFDSSATNVYATQGQVAQSTGPASTESLSYAAPGGGRFYIDLNGASDVQGAFRLSVTILRDHESPVATLRLNGGAAATSDQTVTVTLQATDNLSGIDLMQRSTDGFEWGPVEPYTPTFLWTFAAGDGPKELWARVRDRAGNVSQAARATIRLDTTPPQVIDRSPAPNGGALGVRPTIRVAFNESIVPSTWTDNGLVVQRAGDAIVPGIYTWDPATKTGSFTSSRTLTPGEQLSVGLGSVTDLAGNAPVPIGSWTVTVLKVHEVSVSASPTTLVTGFSTTLSGTIDPPLLGGLTLEASEAGGPWTGVRALSTDLAGRFTTTIPVNGNTSYRVRAEASATEAASTSSPVRVIARRRVDLIGVTPSKTQTTTSGRSLALTARVMPAGPSVLVTLTVSRFDPARRVWVTSSVLKKGSSRGGTAAFAWRPTTKGSYRLRLTTPSTSIVANGLSATYRWTVS